MELKVFVDCIGSVPHAVTVDCNKLVGYMDLFMCSLQGFTPGLFGVFHGALQFMTYEEMKANYNQYRGHPFDQKLVNLLFLILHFFMILLCYRQQRNI